MKIVADLELPWVKNYFGAYGELILKPGRLIENADLKDADLLLVRSVTRVDENLLRHSAVKFVGSVTTGVDHLDTAWLEQAGILWHATVGYNALAVADYVMAVTAAVLPGVEAGYVPQVGVVGVGQIGSQVAERFKGLGFKVFLSDPPRAAQEKDFAATALTKLRDLDLLTVHTPLTRGGKYPTHHLLDQAFLSGARGKNLLINTGRGAAVDSLALKNNQARWAYCCDVWENEPEIDVALLQSALIATPHLAGHSIQTRYRGIEQLYRAFCELQWLKPKVLSLPVPPRQTLSFEGRQLSWQAVVLAIFDPRRPTEKMKALLLKEPGKCATLFDKLRQQYIGGTIKRHEFAYTTVSEVRLTEGDREVLTQFGINFKE